MFIILIKIIIAAAIIFGVFLVVGAIAACMLSSQITREEETQAGRMQE
jgi:hypothetical protein